MDKTLSVLLLAWYDTHRRDLPWRETRDPYRIWLSEIMLQQTRVETVIDYYHRFLEAFPSIEVLAQAEMDAVLKLWEGLGYYRRARLLHQTAQIVVEQYQGSFPSSINELQKLPGIGHYTAGAIASIAFETPALAIDGNVLRVVARMTADPLDRTSSANIAYAKKCLEPMLPPDKRGDFTQALMELGATVCLPNGAPLCPLCPWKDACLALQNGNPLDYPVKVEKKKRPQSAYTLWLLEHQGRYAMERRPNQGVLANMWQFPLLPAIETEIPLHGGISSQQQGPIYRHVFTHIEWIIRLNLVHFINVEPNEYIWKTREEIRASIALPTAFLPAIEFIEKG